MQVLPLLHQQLCLLRPHSQLRQSHPWQLALQHHCQVQSCNIASRDIFEKPICSGLLEIAANIITIFALLFLGRRLSVCGSMAIGQSIGFPISPSLHQNYHCTKAYFTGGVTLFAVPYVDSLAGKAALAQIGRFAITGSFSMVIQQDSLHPKNMDIFHSVIWIAMY